MNDLRPKKLLDLIGQEDNKKILRISLESAKQRNDILPHIMMSGMSGCGKTTMAQCLANELNVDMQYANGASLRSIKNIAPYIMRIKKGDILFWDETHRSTKIVQEFMYSVAEDFFCIIGKGADIIKIDIPKFTLIGATTEFGTLAKPFRERFKTHIIFSLYHTDDLAKLARLNAERLSITIDQDAALDIARRSRGTPRVLNRLLEWCRDYTLTTYQSLNLTIKNTSEALNILEIDENGLTKDDRIVIMILKREGKPVPLNSLVALTGIDEKTLIEEVEPFLIYKGIITKNTKGRLLC